MTMKNITKSQCMIYEHDNTLNDVPLVYTANEWWNGEGIDFSDADENDFSFHMDDLHAICVIAACMGHIDLEAIANEVKQIKLVSEQRSKQLKRFQQDN